ncbi:MAG: hypothetical protein ACLQM8_14815 [Limisphaerales bacterium]
MHSPSAECGSGKPVQSFHPFCEGDLDPTLNKRIRTLIDAEDNYIVYLDDDLYVEYSWTDAYGDKPQGFAGVANKVAHLETLSIIYIAPNQLEAFRRILGEAMARIIGDRDGVKAKESLDLAESFLAERSLEKARTWYLQASSVATAAAVVLAAALWLLRDWVISHAGLNTFEVSVGALLGGVGSFMSIWIRSGRIQMDAGAGKSIHRWEGSARILIGVACAFAVALGVKANIVLGFTKSAEHPLAYLLVICIAAGFSERLFLNLIGHVHDPALTGRKQDKRSPP